MAASSVLPWWCCPRGIPRGSRRSHHLVAARRPSGLADCRTSAVSGRYWPLIQSKQRCPCIRLGVSSFFLAVYPSGLRGRIANPLSAGSNPAAAFPPLCVARGRFSLPPSGPIHCKRAAADRTSSPDSPSLRGSGTSCPIQRRRTRALIEHTAGKASRRHPAGALIPKSHVARLVSSGTLPGARAIGRCQSTRTPPRMEYRG